MTVAELYKKIQRINSENARIISEKGNKISVSEISKMLDSTLDIISEGAQKNALVPYKQISHEMLRSIKELKNILCDNKETGVVLSPRKQEMLGVFNKNIARLESDIELFGCIETAVFKHIEIEVWPGLNYPAGTLVARMQNSKIGIYEFSVEKEGLYVSENWWDKINSIEEAVEKFSGSTLIIGRNTENYPFEETSFQVLINKYHQYAFSNPTINIGFSAKKH